jgi:hypothetical protein
MLQSVVGLYDGNKLELTEEVQVNGIVKVLVTFLDETDTAIKKNALIQRLLSREPVKIAPLKVKDLIEEGRE